MVEETSAGGVVVRPAQGDEGGPQAAVIVRRNRAGRLEWCLPKGHLEGVETAEEAALREVREETGLLAQIRTNLGVIDYWFSGDARRVHKVVHHYLLAMTGGRLTVEDDPDHEAEDAFWVPVATLPDRLSYPNEQRLAVIARQLLAQSPDLAVPLPVESPVVSPGAPPAPMPVVHPRPAPSDGRPRPAPPPLRPTTPGPTHPGVRP
jgi:8-oxo-dGTP pyrophosphatase MutT (NUDIX family)